MSFPCPWRKKSLLQSRAQQGQSEAAASGSPCSGARCTTGGVGVPAESRDGSSVGDSRQEHKAGGGGGCPGSRRVVGSRRAHPCSGPTWHVCECSYLGCAPPILPLSRSFVASSSPSWSFSESACKELSCIHLSDHTLPSQRDFSSCLLLYCFSFFKPQHNPLPVLGVGFVY